MSATTMPLDRLLDPLCRAFDESTAKVLVSLSADTELAAELDELARKSNAGLITETERQRYEAFVSAGSILSVLQSKARLFLRDKGRFVLEDGRQVQLPLAEERLAKVPAVSKLAFVLEDGREVQLPLAEECLAKVTAAPKLAFVLEDGREVQLPLAADYPLGRLAEVTAALHDVEALHQQRLQTLGLLSNDRDRVAGELEKITSRYHDLSCEVHRLHAVESESRHELEAISARKDHALSLLQQLSGRCAVEEGRLTSLEEANKDLEQHLNERRAHVAKLESKISQAGEELEHLIRREFELSQDIQTRTQELIDAEEKLVETIARIQHARTGQSDLSQALAELSAAHDRAAQTANSLRILQSEYRQAAAQTEQTRYEELRINLQDTENEHLTQQQEFQRRQAATEAELRYRSLEAADPALREQL